jgi:hypothetical protein
MAFMVNSDHDGKGGQLLKPAAAGIGQTKTYEAIKEIDRYREENRMFTASTPE